MARSGGLAGEAHDEATDPFDAALPFLTPAQRRNFVDNDVTLNCLALLHGEDLGDLLEGDGGAIGVPDALPGPRGRGGPVRRRGGGDGAPRSQRLRRGGRSEDAAPALWETLDLTPKDEEEEGAWIFSERSRARRVGTKRLAWRD